MLHVTYSLYSGFIGSILFWKDQVFYLATERFIGFFFITCFI